MKSLMYGSFFADRVGKVFSFIKFYIKRFTFVSSMVAFSTMFSNNKVLTLTYLTLCLFITYLCTPKQLLYFHHPSKRCSHNFKTDFKRF